MSSDSDKECVSSGGEGSSAVGPKRKKAKYTQKYKQTWEQDEHFKGWLTRGKTEQEAMCLVCNKNILIGSTGKRMLLRHKDTDRHIKLSKSRKNQQSLTNMTILKQKSSIGEATKTGELYLAAFVSEHNLAYNVMEHMPTLLTKVCSDLEIAKQIKCSRTKCSCLVKNVLGKQNELDIYGILKNEKFSLIIDESTDRGCTKHLSLVCRFRQDKKIQDSFLALIPMKGATGEDIYNKIVHVFNRESIPYKQNLIGFASDGANVMSGKHNSVMSRLLEEIPHIFLMKCICHSMNLCASSACATLPRSVEDLARDIYNYFANSPKRIETFKEFQFFTNTKLHRILHPAQTRWLSLQNVVVRILEQYDALILFFTDAVYSERILAAENILQKLKDPLTRYFFQFLEFSLPFFNNVNKQMQSEKPQIHELHNRISSIYKTFLECFIKRETILSTPIHEINYKNPCNFLPLNDIYLGAKIEVSKAKLDASQVHILRTRCLDFFIEGATQINKRFDFDNIILKNLTLINPTNISGGKNNSIIPLVMNFPNLVKDSDLQTIDTEFRLLRNTKNIECDSNNAENFWNNVERICYADNKPMFPTLTNFVFKMLILPHSSANVERIFSQINLLKTKQRNKLSTASISGLLHSKNYLNSRNKNCGTISFPRDIFKLYNQSMYQYKNKELTDSDSE